jgi:hypothetical protein
VSDEDKVMDVQTDVDDALTTLDRVGDAMREAVSCESSEDLLDNISDALSNARILVDELVTLRDRAVIVGMRERAEKRNAKKREEAEKKK